MKKLLLGLTLLSSMSVFAGESKVVLSCINQDDKAEAHKVYIHMFKDSISRSDLMSSVLCLNNAGDVANGLGANVSLSNLNMNLETSAHTDDNYVWYTMFNKVKLNCDTSADSYTISSENTTSYGEKTSLIRLSGKLTDLNGSYAGSEGGSYSGGPATLTETYYSGGRVIKTKTTVVMCNSAEM